MFLTLCLWIARDVLRQLIACLYADCCKIPWELIACLKNPNVIFFRWMLCFWIVARSFWEMVVLVCCRMKCIDLPLFHANWTMFFYFWIVLIYLSSPQCCLIQLNRLLLKFLPVPFFDSHFNRFTDPILIFTTMIWCIVSIFFTMGLNFWINLIYWDGVDYNMHYI